MYTRKDLINETGLTQRQVDYGLQNLCEMYDIDRTLFNKNNVPNAPYELTEISFRLLKILLLSIRFHPLTIKKDDWSNKDYIEKQKRKVTINQLTDFYEILLENFEKELPIELKVELREHPVYLHTLEELEINKQLNGKLSHFLAAINAIDHDLRIKVWEKLYETFDNLILECFNLQIEKDEYEQEQADGYKKKQLTIRSELDQHYDDLQEQNFTRNSHETKHMQTFDRILANRLKDSLLKHHNSHLRRQQAKINDILANTEAVKREIPIYEFERMQLTKGKLHNIFLSHSSQFERVMGYTAQELNDMYYNVLDNNQNKIKENITKRFLDIETSKFRAMKFLERSKEIIDGIKTNNNGYLENKAIQNRLKSIHNECEALRQDIYDKFEHDDAGEYGDVSDVLEFIIVSIENLVYIDYNREKSLQEYYERYITYYTDVEKLSGKYLELSEMITILPSIEAIVGKDKN